jgi:uncharacterized protein YecE (DUF72 family)
MGWPAIAPADGRLPSTTMLTSCLHCPGLADSGGRLGEVSVKLELVSVTGRYPTGGYVNSGPIDSHSPQSLTVCRQCGSLTAGLNPGSFAAMVELAGSLKALAAEGVFIGTSSWKYPGWIGQAYTHERYLTRGNFSEARFNRTCLAEYAETFPTVCVDAAFYTFPKADSLTELAGMVPPAFRFALKVTDEITVKRFPNLQRFGPKAGRENPHFLDADLFTRAFLAPLESIRPNVGPVILEFGHFHESDFARGREFIAVLNGFLSKLPRGWQLTVEVRNKTFLHADYFSMLRSHGVAHCFNSWERMPPVSEQLEHEDSATADFTAARFLLTPGRKYQAAVDAFSPYAEIKSRDPEARRAAAKLIELTRRKKFRECYIYVNNRLEGNALETIRAVVASLTPA